MTEDLKYQKVMNFVKFVRTLKDQSSNPEKIELYVSLIEHAPCLMVCYYGMSLLLEDEDSTYEKLITDLQFKDLSKEQQDTIRRYIQLFMYFRDNNNTSTNYEPIGLEETCE